MFLLFQSFFTGIISTYAGHVVPVAGVLQALVRFICSYRWSILRKNDVVPRNATSHSRCFLVRKIAAASRVPVRDRHWCRKIVEQAHQVIVHRTNIQWILTRLYSCANQMLYYERKATNYKSQVLRWVVTIKLSWLFELWVVFAKNWPLSHATFPAPQKENN